MDVQANGLFLLQTGIVQLVVKAGNSSVGRRAELVGGGCSVSLRLKTTRIAVPLEEYACHQAGGTLRERLPNDTAKCLRVRCCVHCNRVNGTPTRCPLPSPQPAGPLTRSITSRGEGRRSQTGNSSFSRRPTSGNNLQRKVFSRRAHRVKVVLHT